jgi:hypothetical protein
MRTGLVAGVAALGFLVAGCGQQAVAPVLDSALATPSATADLPSAGPSPTPHPTPTPAAGPDAGCTSIGIMLTNSDNGKTLCVHEGTDIVVMLTGDSGGIRASGPLTPRPALVPALEPGVTGAAFVAGQPGIARIVSVLSPCGSGPGIHCMLLMLYHVTVNVVAPAS